MANIGRRYPAEYRMRLVGLGAGGEELARESEASRKRIARLMRALEIGGVSSRRWKGPDTIGRPGNSDRARNCPKRTAPSASARPVSPAGEVGSRCGQR